ncbi:MAG TPA: ZIP family metal transporter, partial [Candidatus Udaeobacter sp.]|nr:ZIP family metal transporter [Candidatus Udaeobacter sp.]
LFVALGAGVFLGAVFLHLLPELADARPSPGVALLVPLSIVTLFAIERLRFHGPSADENGHVHPNRNPHGTHDVLGHATLFGLAVHSLAMGFGLAVGGATPDLQLAIFLSILGHKTAEAFSLSTVLLLAGTSPAKVAARVAFLALMTPLGCLIGILSLAALPPGAALAPTAIAVGTFLYVALMDILPEVLHQRQDLGTKVLLVLAGLGLMACLRAAHGHGAHLSWG